MKRIFVLFMTVIFVSATAEATLFKKGDKVVDKRTGDVYEFQYKADIGIYSADSGLGELFIINGKVYAITPQGVTGMKAVSERTDVRAELSAALKRYRSKKAEAARAWKALAAEKAKQNDYDDSEWHYQRMMLNKKDLEIQRLKVTIGELQEWGDLAGQALVESKDSLARVGAFLKEVERERHLWNVCWIVTFGVLCIVFMSAIFYCRHTSQRIAAKPAEVIEIIDLTDLT